MEFYTHKDIEKALGITCNAVEKRLSRLGLKEEKREGRTKLYSAATFKAMIEYQPHPRGGRFGGHLSQSSKPVEYYRVSVLEYVPSLEKEAFVIKHFYPKTKAEKFIQDCRDINIQARMVLCKGMR